MRALSIRQPYAELILRGLKTIEYRSRSTRIVGERFHIYAAGKWADADAVGRAARVFSHDLSTEQPPAWMMEFAERFVLRDLPTGVIVGSAVIDRVTQGTEGVYEWHLRDVERAADLVKPTRHPQPAWFNPF